MSLPPSLQRRSIGDAAECDNSVDSGYDGVMLELYQSEDCSDCARVREKLAALRMKYVIRTVPIDRARRQRVTEAGGRPDIPLLLDPERGRTTYDADEIVNVLGADDLFGVDEEPDEALARLVQVEGERASA